MSALQNIPVGTKINNWTLIERGKNPDSGKIGCRVRCVCGFERWMATNYFQTGRSKGCAACAGSAEIPVEPGEQFGSWVVLQKAEAWQLAPRTRGVHFSCRCECGTEAVVSSYCLRHGLSTKCKACLGKYKDHGEVPGTYMSQLMGRVRSRERNSNRQIEVAIELSDLYEQWVAQDGKCALTGWPLDHSRRWKGEATASLDRIDSARGYTPDNIQWVHKYINRAKSNMTDEAFIQMCVAVVQHRG